jgi:hypothetical protein
MVMLALMISAMETSLHSKLLALTPTTLATLQTFASTLLDAILPLVALNHLESALTLLISARLLFVTRLQDAFSSPLLVWFLIPIVTLEFVIQLWDNV